MLPTPYWCYNIYWFKHIQWSTNAVIFHWSVHQSHCVTDSLEPLPPVFHQFDMTGRLSRHLFCCIQVQTTACRFIHRTTWLHTSVSLSPEDFPMVNHSTQDRSVVVVFGGSFYRAGKAWGLFVDLSLLSVAKNSWRLSVKRSSYLQSGQLDLENLPLVLFFLHPDGKQMKGLVVGCIIWQIFLLKSK